MKQPLEGPLRRDISLTEIEYRGWQEASKWIERVSIGRRSPRAQALLARRAPTLASGDAALALLKDTLPKRFFAGATDPAGLALVGGGCDEHRRAILEEARQLLDGRFQLLGYRNLRFGDPIDWYLDPVSGCRAPRLHWSRIDPLDATVVGDSKVIWELNRHQWIVRLAQAYAISKDERYAAACTGAIDSWLEANPTGVGINWASSLEVSYRLIAWCWTIVLLRDSAAITGDWTMKLLAAVWTHANHIRRYLSYYFSPNTHLTGEALGLFYAGALFPEFRASGQWRKTAERILVDESAAQVRPDGVHFEQSTCYQRYTIEIYLHFVELASRNAVTLPAAVRARLERMVEFLLAVRHPDGTMPQIGDADGGTLLPLAVRKPEDCRGVFAMAAAVLGREDFAWAAEGDGAEAIWFIGRDASRLTTKKADPPPAAEPSSVFSSGGLAVMRSGWDRDSHQLIIDAGPLGCPISGGHGHADLLGIQCAIYGEPCLVDPGTGTYAANSRWRDYFRSTGAHSTVRVDGQNQAQTAGPFRWRARPAARLSAWEFGSDVEFVDATHDAYGRLPNPVIHRRRVFFIKRDYWVVVDDLTGVSTHEIEVRFQFAPLNVALDSGAIRATSPSGNTLWLVPFASAPVKSEVVAGWVSPDYGQREAAPAVVLSYAAALPARVLTVLLPERGTPAAPPVLRAMYDAGGRPSGVTFEDSSDVRYRRPFAL